MADEPGKMTRRELIARGMRGAGLLCAAGGLGALVTRGSAEGLVWQIDPKKCIACGKCATECVLNPSAVKCVHEHEICGYCELCFGYYVDQRLDDQETAENRRCPTDAIRRALVEDPYHQYIVEEDNCIGCGLCVEGCQQFGNGSLVLQVRHDRCLNCNFCAIAAVCPSDAFQRVPASDPYLLRVEKPGTA